MTPFGRWWTFGAVLLVACGFVGLHERWPVSAVVAWLCVSIGWACVAFWGLNR